MKAPAPGISPDRLPRGALQLAPEDRDLPAFLRAVVYGSGPWLAVLTVVLVFRVATRGAPEVFLAFQGALVYTFLAAMLVLGPVMLVLARFVADQLYAGRSEDARHAVEGAAGLAALAAAALAIAYALLRGDVPWPLTLTSVAFLAALEASWVVGVGLYGVKYYGYVGGAAALAAVVAMPLGVTLALHQGWGAPGLLAGLAGGQVLALVVLVIGLHQAMPASEERRYGLLEWYRRYPDLALAGTLQMIGLVLLPTLTWAIAGREEVPGFTTRWDLDVPLFFAYLVVLPGQAAFLQEVERDFQTEYRRFLVRVELGSAAEIEDARSRLEACTDDAFWWPLRLQVVVSALALVYLYPQLSRLGIFGLDPWLTAVLVAASTTHVGVLSLAVLAQYLDRRRALLETLGALVAVHVLLTPALVAAREPGPAWGIGYLAGGLVALAWGRRRIRAAARQMDYLVMFDGTMADHEGRSIEYGPPEPLEEVPWEAEAEAG